MSIVQSNLISQFVLQIILQKAKRKAYFDKMIRDNLTKYCSKQSLKYYHEAYNQSNRAPQFQQQCELQSQPKALIQDNFFPSAAAIDQAQKLFSQKKTGSSDKRQLKIQRTLTQRSISQVSQPKKAAKVQAPSPFQKLDLVQPQQQQTILKQLRKQIIQNQAKQQTPNLKIKQEKSKKKQGRQEKIGFDYNGQPVKIKQQGRNHLISNGLNGQTLKTAQKLKQVKKNTQITQVVYQRKDKKSLKFGKNLDIQFTQIKSLLSQAKATKGIKFTQGNNILQDKRKPIHVNELIKTLTQRKLSKIQYNRIKQSTGSVAQFDEYSTSRQKTNTLVTQIRNQLEDNGSLMRSASQSKLSNTLSRRKSTVTVSDPNLLQVLISGTQNQNIIKQKTRKNAEQKQENSLGKFDSNDYYNLQYLRTGGSMNKIKKSKSVVNFDQIVLPKIQTHRFQMPRVRQRIKEKQQIVRQIRRKFEQKLRT